MLCLCLCVYVSVTHVQDLGPEHEDPGSLECMRSLRTIGDTNWQVYVGPDVQVWVGVLKEEGAARHMVGFCAGSDLHLWL